MFIPSHPFQIIDWSLLPKERHHGESSYADWQVVQMGNIRIRRLKYAPGYKADHWCYKGHIIHCLEGSMTTELEDGRMKVLHSGATYIVGDESVAHRTFTEEGCVLFVID